MITGELHRARLVTMVKRFLDLAFSVSCLLLLLPFLLLVWLLVRGMSSGPGIYVQPRVGLHGVVFRMYKFRTMIDQADSIGSYQTKQNDPRITPIGRLLRKTSIDEVPQLFNVIKGDMSLVGPRPDTPMQRERYSQEQWERRTSVRPGITGLAQATRRSLANHEERLAMDFHYIDHHSVWLDLKIIALTVTKLTGRGSN